MAVFVPVPPARQHVVVALLAGAPSTKMPVVLAIKTGQSVDPVPQAGQPEVLASVVLSPPAGQAVVRAPQVGPGRQLSHHLKE